jgi:putative DNA primase/helicase
VLPFFYGTGRNGKSVIANALRRALGDYAVEIAPDVLMESHHEQHPTHVAVLRGARFVVASEIDSGRRWNESRLKRLTGGDPISARYMRGDLFEFEPTHTLLIVGNQKPGLRVVDEAMRSRMHLIGFNVTIPEAERDPRLPEALESEYGGILAWALEGCLAWQRRGLAPPAAVRAATEAYLEGEDSIRQWVAECCRPAGQLTLSAAHHNYRGWCEQNAVPALGRNSFGDQLEAHGYRRTEIRRRVWVFNGLSLPVHGEVRYAD